MLPRRPILVVSAGCLLAGQVAAQSVADVYDEGVLRTYEITFHQANWQTRLTQNKASKTYIKADLKVDGQKGAGGNQHTPALTYLGNVPSNYTKVPWRCGSPGRPNEDAPGRHPCQHPGADAPGPFPAWPGGRP